MIVSHISFCSWEIARLRQTVRKEERERAREGSESGGGERGKELVGEGRST
jgi:hypothetical protein